MRDELVRAAVLSGADADTIVRVHRLAPLVEHSLRLQKAIASEELVDALVVERYGWLIDELRRARRESLLAWARVAALEVTA